MRFVSAQGGESADQILLSIRNASMQINPQEIKGVKSLTSKASPSQVVDRYIAEGVDSALAS